MKKRFMYLILPVVTLILEALPWGAVLNFANPEGEPWRETFSYFSLTPFGYANFGPFLTAVSTCVLAVLLAVYWITGKYGLVSKVRGLLYAGIVFSLAPLVYGLRSFSVVGLLITLTLAVELLLIRAAVKES